MKHLFSPFRILGMMVAVGDFLCFQVSLAIGYLLWVRIPWHGNWQYFQEFSLMLWILPPIAIIVFKSIGLYKPEMGVIGVQEQSLVFKAIWIIYFLVFALAFFMREESFSRLATLYSMVIALVLVSVERYLVRRWYSWLNQKGIANRKAIIYGAGFHGVRLDRWIRQTPQLGIHVLGFLDDNVDQLVKKPSPESLLGGLAQLKTLVKETGVEILFVAHRKLPEEQVIEILQICKEYKIQCWVIPSLYHLHVEQVELYHIGGIPLLGFKQQFSRRSYEFMKHLMDRGIALLLLILVSPLLLVIALAILITAGQPIFFQQVRVGKRHKKFVIHKFRTLRSEQNKEAISPELEKEGKRSMMTPLGSFLRRTGLDEIPQLFNVLKGEMSLVGPRPEMPFLVSHYGPLERERLAVKPGITGLWQISEDRKRLLIHENMDYDLYYVEHMSFNLDLAILLKTFFAVLKRFFPSSNEEKPLVRTPEK